MSRGSVSLPGRVEGRVTRHDESDSHATRDAALVRAARPTAHGNRRLGIGRILRQTRGASQPKYR